jgi:Bacterial membrane protein YfhO
MIRPLNSRWRLKKDQLAAIAVTLAPLFYFLPALLDHLVLGPDDGMLFNVPLRVAAAQIVRTGHLPLWNPYIFGGMPLLAAAQGGVLFPLNWFFLICSPALATDLMVISAYMVAALGAYLFARRTGASLTGSVVTSLVWQGGGFLIGQISHINIVHTAAMLPWVLWALERYVSSGSRARGAVLAALVALQVFAGHQQTSAYSLILVGAYAIVMALANRQTRNRYLAALAFTAAGLLLAAVQIVPTAELLRNSSRATATYDFFVSFSMPRRFVSTLLAPYVMGGGDGRLFRAPYIGQAFYTEYAPYAGVLAVMLTLIALLLKPDARTKFWAVAGVICLALALGSNAPLGLYRLIYHVPILNLFRVPARHLMEVNFAIAMLAGRGLTALAALRESPAMRRRVAFVAGLVFLITCLVVTWWRPEEFHLGRQAPVSLLRAPELFLPIVTAAVSAMTLWAFARKRRGATAMLLAVLVIDLFVWGQSSGWYKDSRQIPREFWRVPETVELLSENAPKDAASYRILTTRETFYPGPSPTTRPHDWVLWIEPDVYMMFGIQNAAGYDGFGLERYSKLAGQMKLWGEVTDPDATLRGSSREIDLLNARYLLAIRKRSGDAAPEASADEGALSNGSAFPVATEKHAGFLFASSDLPLPSLSADKPWHLSMPPVETDHIALLTSLSWAENVPDNAVVGRLRLRAKDGRILEFELQAGRDTADWAFDRSDIHAHIRHQRATVATSYGVSDNRYTYQAHTYLTSFAFPEKTIIESGEIELEPNAQSPGLLLNVQRVSLVNEGEGKFYPLDREMIAAGNAAAEKAATPHQDERWQLIAEARNVNIYQNARALPRVWLAPEVRVFDDDTMLQIIRTGILPGGSKWDPLHTVMAETPTPLATGAQNVSTQITSYEPNRIKVQAHADAPAVLVLSENYYPGWRVEVDGESAELLRVNYALRGVVIPAGDHQVSFVYRPWSIMGGLLLSLVTLAALVILSVWRNESIAAPALIEKH